MWNRVALGAVLLGMFAPAGAHADYLEGGRCVSSTVMCRETIPCVDGQVCRFLSGGEMGVCEPVDRPRCCATNADCLGDGEDCVPVPRLSDTAGSIMGLCLPEEDFCDGSVAAVQRCLSNGDGPRLYPAGDCDGDGVANAEDDSLCPPPRGYDDGDGCAELEQCFPEFANCRLGGVEGACVNLETGHYCLPSDDLKEVVFCGEPFACPEFNVEFTSEGETFCSPTVCAPLPPRTCMTRESDIDEVVPWAEGDCDRDGVPNGAEFSGDRDPCAADEEPDAGLPPIDAGPADAGTVDAGSSMPGGDASAEEDAGTPTGDASTAVDAGTDRAINFEGGGGCACRAAPPAPGSGWPAWACAGGIGLAWLLRRRV